MSLTRCLLVPFTGAMLLASDGNAEILTGPIEARVLAVVDGDSLIAMARVWPGQDIEAHIRLLGIDTAEMKARCKSERLKALDARAALLKLIDGRRVTLTRIRRGKYFGRVLARVEAHNGTDLSAAMLKSGHARAYAGRNRQNWCD